MVPPRPNTEEHEPNITFIHSGPIVEEVHYKIEWYIILGYWILLLIFISVCVYKKLVLDAA